MSNGLRRLTEKALRLQRRFLQCGCAAWSPAWCSGLSEAMSCQGWGLRQVQPLLCHVLWSLGDLLLSLSPLVTHWGHSHGADPSRCVEREPIGVNQFLRALPGTQ